jgi:hypothetical protein
MEGFTTETALEPIKRGRNGNLPQIHGMDWIKEKIENLVLRDF